MVLNIHHRGGRSTLEKTTDFRDKDKEKRWAKKLLCFHQQLQRWTLPALQTLRAAISTVLNGVVKPNRTHHRKRV